MKLVEKGIVNGQQRMTNEDDYSHRTLLGFAKYFQNILGVHMYIYVLLNFLVGLIDGLGLAMFIPLMGTATGTITGQDSLGKLSFVTDIFERFGMSLSLFNVLLLMVSLFSLKGVISYFKQLYFIKLRLFVIREIRLQLIDDLSNLSYEGYTNSDPGRIQFVMVGETGRLVKAMTMFISMLQTFVVLLTYIGLAFLANWQFAVLVAIGGGLSNFLYRFINKSTKKQATEISKIGNRFNRFLIQAIHNFKYLKATDNFKVYDNNLRLAIEEGENTSYNIGRLNAIASNLREPVIILIIACVILLQVQLLGGDFSSIMIGILLFYRALNYLVTLQNSYNAFLASSPGLNAVEDLHEDFTNEAEPSNQIEIKSKIGKINCINITVDLGNTSILKDINLNINPYTTIALVGESGAGKSTLANVICGLIQPTTGQLMINDVSLWPNHIKSYRNKVGYISQEPVIFADTIFNNVTFWSEPTPNTIKKFNKVMKLVHLHHFVDSLEDGMNSFLGNNGILVSGGQKQRISIARELFRDVELLIMDEATSALDSETESIIKENIESLHGQYTMVIIAHRLSTIKHSDKIFVMEGGRIINEGSYEELYGISDTFRKMVELQEI